MLDNGFIKVNGKTEKASYKVRVNDCIDIEAGFIEESNIVPVKMDINIVYEDDDLMVIDKPSGLVVHPGSGNYDNTLVNALLFHCGDKLSNINNPIRPGIVHRLDKDTTGLMVVAKNNHTHEILKQQLKDRILKRKYNAVIWGNILPPQGIIEGYIDRCKVNRLKMELTKDNTGKYSLTNYKTLENYGDVASLVECELDTGRTHQIRVHFSSKKHPLIGDYTYGGNLRKIKGEENEYKSFVEHFPRQALHSKVIRFVHPTTQEDMFFESDLPQDMVDLLGNLEMLNKIK
jgi:23S rRNA pseudouridine1911/1915/1917 synthase